MALVVERRGSERRRAGPRSAVRARRPRTRRNRRRPVRCGGPPARIGRCGTTPTTSLRNRFAAHPIPRGSGRGGHRGSGRPGGARGCRGSVDGREPGHGGLSAAPDALVRTVPQGVTSGGAPGRRARPRAVEPITAPPRCSLSALARRRQVRPRHPLRWNGSAPRPDGRRLLRADRGARRAAEQRGRTGARHRRGRRHPRLGPSARDEPSSRAQRYRGSRRASTIPSTVSTPHSTRVNDSGTEEPPDEPTSASAPIGSSPPATAVPNEMHRPVPV